MKSVTDILKISTHYYLKMEGCEGWGDWLACTPAMKFFWSGVFWQPESAFQLFSQLYWNSKTILNLWVCHFTLTLTLWCGNGLRKDYSYCNDTTFYGRERPINISEKLEAWNWNRQNLLLAISDLLLLLLQFKSINAASSSLLEMSKIKYMHIISPDDH